VFAAAVQVVEAVPEPETVTGFCPKLPSLQVKVILPPVTGDDRLSRTVIEMSMVLKVVVDEGFRVCAVVVERCSATTLTLVLLLLGWY